MISPDLVTTVITNLAVAIPIALGALIPLVSKHRRDLAEAQADYNKKLILQNTALQEQIDALRTQHRTEIAELRVENAERKAAEHKCERNLLLLKNALAEAGVLTKFQMEDKSAFHDQRQEGL